MLSLDALGMTIRDDDDSNGGVSDLVRRAHDGVVVVVGRLARGGRRHAARQLLLDVVDRVLHALDLVLQPLLQQHGSIRKDLRRENLQER